MQLRHGFESREGPPMDRPPFEWRFLVVILVLAASGCARSADLGDGTNLDLSPGSGPGCPIPGPAIPFANQSIREASGIARSQRTPCVFWVHDDSGSDPVLYAFDAAAADLGAVRLDAEAVDWEDIASFELEGMPFLLIADVGNNARSRSPVTLLVIPEPTLTVDRSLPAPITSTVKIAVSFPDARFDLEAVAVDPDTDEILFVSKGLPAVLLPADPSGPNQGLYSVPLKRAIADGKATLEFQTVIPGIRPGPGDDPATEYNYGVGGGLATAMDLRPDRAEVAILTYREVLVWTRGAGQSWAETLQGVPRSVAVPEPGRDQMEGVSYSHDGALLLVADEQGQTNSEFSVVSAR
jgi:hypothetical protein